MHPADKTMTSSLQQRARGGAAAQPTAAGGGAFESCFSAGLDLTEFGSGGNDHATANAHPAPRVAASAELACQKLEETRQEAALARRVADVVDASKYASSSDELGASVPRALHPDNAPDEAIGKGRDDNFVQFLDGAGTKDGNFLSSLVSNHRAEGKEGTLSHKSRALLRNKSQQMKKIVGGRGQRPPTRQRPVQGGKKGAVGRTIAKKSRKSKH